MFRLRSALLAAVFIAWLIPAACAEQEKDELKTPCSVQTIASLSAKLGAAEPQPYTKGALFEHVPSDVAQLAHEPHDATSAILLAVPLDESQFRAVYHKESTEVVAYSESKQIAEAKEIAAKSKIEADSKILTRSDFQSFLRRAPEKHIFVVGHNHLGEFTFITGNRESLVALSEDCNRANKICVFISCNSDDHKLDGSIGVQRKLTLAEGIWITKELQTWLRNQPSEVTIEELAAHARKIEGLAHIKYHVSYIAFKACAAAGTTSMVYLLIEGVNTSKH